MAVAAETTAARPNELATRLGAIRVGLRPDLEVSRHVYRGEPCYVFRDRLTFQSHRFSAEDYAVLVQLDATRSLADTFASLVEAGLLAPADEERFYGFVLRLHQQTLLQLPIADDAQLYRRYRARQTARLRQRTLGIMFLQVPLCDPSAFLDRTIDHVRPIFSRWFVGLWLVVILTACSVAAMRAHDLARPLDELLAGRNLLIMWVTLIVLKTFHEFGHAYICRYFGGHVPEMGAYLIAGTPCAYVDATSSWGFPSKWRRIAVALGGMYVELFIAALAVFVWALAEGPLVRAIAYNVIFLAGVTTILYNVNPLMRGDGYYILSDLTGIPNLRGRARRTVLDLLKRRVVGAPLPPPGHPPVVHGMLLAFGAAAGLYRTTVVFGIAAVVAIKLPVIGLLLAAFFLAGAILRPVVATLRYLLEAKETAPVRVRATLLAMAGLIIGPTLVLGLPIRWPIYVRGVTAPESEVLVRAGAAGFLDAWQVEPGERVEVGEPLGTFTNGSITDRRADIAAELSAAKLRLAAYQLTDPWRSAAERATIEALQAAYEQARRDADALDLVSGVSGTVLACVARSELGRFVERGEPLATVADERWTVRCLLDERQIAAAQVSIGDLIQFRALSTPGVVLEGEVYYVEPAATRDVGRRTPLHVGGSGVQVDARGQAAQPYLEVRARLHGDAVGLAGHGAAGSVRLATRSAAPLGLHAYRSVVRFLNDLWAQ